VLLRALTDLVCASSSCTDDIDPANAWVPTDIHVRVYAAEHPFSKGIAHRMTPDAPPNSRVKPAFIRASRH
jgi:aminomethyltransferase